MYQKKVVTLIVCAGMVLSLNAFAKQNKDKYQNEESVQYEMQEQKHDPLAHGIEKEKYKKVEVKKQKTLPSGLQKKVQRTGKLPKGWEDKLKKGEVLSPDMLSHATLVDKKLYPKEFQQDSLSQIYRIEDKVIRVIKDTNEIINILK